MKIAESMRWTMKLRVKELLKEKGKTKYWLYIQMGLSYQNFNRLINGETKSIKFMVK